MSAFRLFSFSTNSILSCRSLLYSRKTFKSFEEQRALISNKTLEQLGISAKPKRPYSAYIRFLQSMLPKMKQSNPNLKSTELMKAVGQEWSKYDPEKKKELQQEFLSDLEIYLKEIEAYQNSLTPEQRNLIQKAKEQKKRSKEHALLLQKKESLGRPKKPPSAFINFMMERKAQKDESLKHSEWLRRIGREWEIMPDERKDKYKDEAKIAFGKYKSDMITWEENMIRQGHLDVVRYKHTFQNTSDKKKLSKTTT